MINAIGQAKPSKKQKPNSIELAYPAGTTCIKSANSMQPKEFVQHVANAIVRYPYLRCRISQLMLNSLVHNMSCTEIGDYMLDSYISHTMTSHQLRMLDELISLT